MTDLNHQDLNDQADQLAQSAYAAVQQSLPGLPPFEELPVELRSFWYSTAVLTQTFALYPEVVNPIPNGSHSGATAWGFTAGVVPGSPEPEFNKQWAMTSEEYHGPHGADIFTWRSLAAAMHSQQLNNPQRLNWTKLEWIRY